MKRNFLTLCSLAIASAAVCAAGVPVTPVPEPGSILLLGTVAAGIGYATWRRNRKK